MGKAHLYKRDDTWRKFKLWGSPTGGKKPPTKVV